LFPSDIEAQAVVVLAAARTKGLRIATAESCTGGLVAGALTEIAGSSDVFERGFVTYSNDSKTAVLGVPAAMVAAQGAVSEVVARAMAQGAARVSGTPVTVAVTGVAGPGGGSAAKPVGLVHFAVVGPDGESHVERRFGDIGRSKIREDSVRQALRMLIEAIG